MPTRFTEFSVVRFLISNIEKIFLAFPIPQSSLSYATTKSSETLCHHAYRASSNLDYVTRVSLTHLCEFMSAGTSAAVSILECVVITLKKLSLIVALSPGSLVVRDGKRRVQTCDSLCSIDRFKCILWWMVGSSRVAWNFFQSVINTGKLFLISQSGKLLS